MTLVIQQRLIVDFEIIEMIRVVIIQSNRNFISRFFNPRNAIKADINSIYNRGFSEGVLKKVFLA
jgi:hypothetical protein